MFKLNNVSSVNIELKPKVKKIVKKVKKPLVIVKEDNEV